MRKVIWLSLIMLTLTFIGFAGGCYTGRLMRVREEVRVNIPMFVRMHNDLLNGKLDRTTNYLGMYLMDQTKRYNDLQENFFLRMATMKSYFDSPGFQTSLVEARSIAAQQATNMVWIGPAKKGGRNE